MASPDRTAARIVAVIVLITVAILALMVALYHRWL